MTDQEIEEARAWVAWEGWRWLPGMSVTLGGKGGARIAAAGAGFLYTVNNGVWSDDGVMPDPSDPATRGCLLHLVREWRTDPGLICRPGDGGWCAVTSSLRVVGRSPTESRALLAAAQAPR